MPDLPIDTLFIIGLLLASFVGKLLEGRAKSKKHPSNEERDLLSEKEIKDTEGKKNLGDILRETFGEVIEPIPAQYTRDDNKEQKYSKRKSNLTSRSLDNPKIQTKNSLASESEKVAFSVVEKSTRDWLKEEAFASNRSVRKAFLIKEILDQPPGLRR